MKIYSDGKTNDRQTNFTITGLKREQLDRLRTGLNISGVIYDLLARLKDRDAIFFLETLGKLSDSVGMRDRLDLFVRIENLQLTEQEIQSLKSDCFEKGLEAKFFLIEFNMENDNLHISRTL